MSKKQNIYSKNNTIKMAKKSTQTESSFKKKAKRKGKMSKKHSNRKGSKNYKKSYRGQGR